MYVFVAGAVADGEQATADRQQDDDDIVNLILQLEDEQQERYQRETGF